MSFHSGKYTTDVLLEKANAMGTLLGQSSNNETVKTSFNGYGLLDQAYLIYLVKDKYPSAYRIMEKWFEENKKRAPLPQDRTDDQLMIREIKETRDMFQRNREMPSRTSRVGQLVGELDVLITETLKRASKKSGKLNLDEEWSTDLSDELVTFAEEKGITLGKLLWILQFTVQFHRLTNGMITRDQMELLLQKMYAPEPIPLFDYRSDDAMAAVYLARTAGYWLDAKTPPNKPLIKAAIEYYLAKARFSVKNGDAVPAEKFKSPFQDDPKLFLTAAARLNLVPRMDLDAFLDKTAHLQISPEDLFMIYTKLHNN